MADLTPNEFRLVHPLGEFQSSPFERIQVEEVTNLVHRLAAYPNQQVNFALVLNGTSSNAADNIRQIKFLGLDTSNLVVLPPVNFSETQVLPWESLGFLRHFKPFGNIKISTLFILVDCKTKHLMTSSYVRDLGLEDQVTNIVFVGCADDSIFAFHYDLTVNKPKCNIFSEMLDYMGIAIVGGFLHKQFTENSNVNCFQKAFIRLSEDTSKVSPVFFSDPRILWSIDEASFRPPQDIRAVLEPAHLITKDLEDLKTYKSLNKLKMFTIRGSFDPRTLPIIPSVEQFVWLVMGVVSVNGPMIARAFPNLNVLTLTVHEKMNLTLELEYFTGLKILILQGLTKQSRIICNPNKYHTLSALAFYDCEGKIENVEKLFVKRLVLSGNPPLVGKYSPSLLSRAFTLYDLQKGIVGGLERDSSEKLRAEYEKVMKKRQQVKAMLDSLEKKVQEKADVVRSPNDFACASCAL